MTPLPITWQRLVSADGKTCPRCDATYQHLQGAIAKLKEVLKPLNVEPTFELREIGESSFRNEPGQSNRIWIAGKPIAEWLRGKRWKQHLLFGLWRYTLSDDKSARSRLRGRS